MGILRKVLLLIICLPILPSAAAISLHIVTEDLPPLHTVSKNKKLSGPMVDIVNEVLKEASFEANIETYPWTISYQLALSEANTLIFSMLRNKDREDKFHWIGKLYSLKSYFVALKSRTDIKISDIEDAKKYSVASIRHDLAESYLRKKGFIIDYNLYLSDMYPNLWSLLFKKRVDLAFTNSLIWRFEIEKTGLDPKQITLVYQVPDFASDLYLAASLKTDRKVIESLTKALDKIKQDGRYQSILDKWGL